MRAYLFPGQGSQFEGMGKDLWDKSNSARDFFEQANDEMGFDIAKVMFEGSAEELKQTLITQPAIYLYTVILTRDSRDFKPDVVAGHSLGEFAALAAVRALPFFEGLRLVKVRAEAMQRACDAQESGMAAVLGLEDHIIMDTVDRIKDETVVVANYNCPSQVVISGTEQGLVAAEEALLEAGARKVLRLRVAGAFHSPVMEEAREEVALAIEKARIRKPTVPVYQNASATPTQDPEEIRANLIRHLTSPVRWTETIQNMITDGVESFVEIGDRQILQGMVKRIDKRAVTKNLQVV